MVIDWIIFSVLVVWSVFAAFQGMRKKEEKPKHKIRFYLSDIALSMAVLGLFFILKPSNFSTLSFHGLDLGIPVGDDIMVIIYAVVTTPFFLAFTPWSNLYPKDIASAKAIFGFPVVFLPDSGKEFLAFFMYILVGVLFEELIARLLMFHALHATLHFDGDALVLVSALFFAVGHFYQGWKGILSNLILGLILGKIFLLKGHLIYPMVLHLALNLTIVVLAFRRWRGLGDELN